MSENGGARAKLVSRMVQSYQNLKNIVNGHGFGCIIRYKRFGTVQILFNL